MLLFFSVPTKILFTLMLICWFRQGATGDQIVEALIANSATFDKKTSFSQVSIINYCVQTYNTGVYLKEMLIPAYIQEKYRLRKQKKYAPRVLLRRPFARRYLLPHNILNLGNMTLIF